MKQYFLHDGNKQSGGFSLEEISKMQLNPTDHVWFDGLPDWQPVGNFEELKPFIKYPNTELTQPPVFNKPDIVSANPPTNSAQAVTELESTTAVIINPTDKLYSANAMGLSTVLLPSVIGGYFFAYHNFKVVGDIKFARKILIEGVVITLLQLAILYLSPFGSDPKGSGYFNYIVTIVANGIIAFKMNKIFKEKYGIDITKPKLQSVPFYKWQLVVHSILFFISYIILIVFISSFDRNTEKEPPFFNAALFESRLKEWDNNEKQSRVYVNKADKPYSAKGDSTNYYVNQIILIVEENEKIIDSARSMENIDSAKYNYADIIYHYTLAKKEYFQLFNNLYQPGQGAPKSRELDKAANRLAEAKKALESAISANANH